MTEARDAGNENIVEQGTVTPWRMILLRENHALKQELATLGAERDQLRAERDYFFDSSAKNSLALDRVIEALKRQSGRAKSAESSNKALRQALGEIVQSYDAYRKRGVLPAPDAYQIMVGAIQRGRAALALPGEAAQEK